MSNKLLNSSLKNILEELYQKYAVKSFIVSDPVQFPHRYKKEEDIEIAAFVAAMIAQGRRTAIIKNLTNLFDYIDSCGGPFSYLNKFDYKRELKKLSFFSHFAYRNITSNDLSTFLYVFHRVLKCKGSFKNLVAQYAFSGNIIKTQIGIMDEFYSIELPTELEVTPSVKMVLTHPSRGSACKRLNMFFRWMVRKDDIDFGIFDNLNKSDLLIPLDTHVANIGRVLGLTGRKQNDIKTAIEITNRLKELDIIDPIKYDFALFGYGIDKEKKDSLIPE